MDTLSILSGYNLSSKQQGQINPLKILLIHLLSATMTTYLKPTKHTPTRGISRESHHTLLPFLINKYHYAVYPTPIRPFSKM